MGERRACRVLGQARAVQRYTPIERDDEDALTRRIVELALVYGRYGTPRVTALLRREGWCVNHKRVERIWKREGLKLPMRQPRRGRLWLNDGNCVRLRPEKKDHVWAYDFVHARTHDSRPLRLLVIVDEHTRECLANDVARKLTSDDVLERLAWLMAMRGVPYHLRSDNGPEFTARVVRERLGSVGVKTLFIGPGSLWENGYVESLNGRLRDELLNRESLETLPEARVLIERWREHDNTVRPHSALGYRAPAPDVIVSSLHLPVMRSGHVGGELSKFGAAPPAPSMRPSRQRAPRAWMLATSARRSSGDMRAGPVKSRRSDTSGLRAEAWSSTVRGRWRQVWDRAAVHHGRRLDTCAMAV